MLLSLPRESETARRLLRRHPRHRPVSRTPPSPPPARRSAHDYDWQLARPRGVELRAGMFAAAVLRDDDVDVVSSMSASSPSRVYGRGRGGPRSAAAAGRRVVTQRIRNQASGTPAKAERPWRPVVRSTREPSSGRRAAASSNPRPSASGLPGTRSRVGAPAQERHAGLLGGAGDAGRDALGKGWVASTRDELPTGEVIGIEWGADVAANVDLDEFMVFEQNQDRARNFFRGLLFKDVTAGSNDGADPVIAALKSEAKLVREGFTDKRAFDELVRAAEGVPRDAINIAARAALRAAERQISVSDVRAAARAWFQNDKEAALRSRDEAQRLLNWIIDKVIRRARGFLVNQKAAAEPLLLALFDARVLHAVRRGYSAQDEPGERYDVYVIDYGAYVDLIHTKPEPLVTLPSDDVSDADGGCAFGSASLPVHNA